VTPHRRLGVIAKLALFRTASVLLLDLSLRRHDRGVYG
jgi:hypothetical protein